MKFEELLKKHKEMSMEELLKEIMDHSTNMRGVLVTYNQGIPVETYHRAKESYGCIENCVEELLNRINPKRREHH